MPSPVAGRYEVLRVLGEGAGGVVRLARDVESGALVALKTLAARDPQQIFRLKSEFRALAELAHPHLVGVHGLVTDGDEPVLVTELVLGPDLMDHLRPGGALVTDAAGAPDWGRVRLAFRQLAAGLLALHASGRVHRDLKPGNVLVEAKTGRVVLLDLGLALDAGTAERGVFGTPEYMAPEQAGKAVGPAADWYGLGSLLYEALTGRPPFTGEPLDVLVRKHREAPPLPSTLARDLPADLERLAMALLATAPRARPKGPAVIQRLGGDAADALAAPPEEEELLGREAELLALEEARRASRAEGRIVVVTGEPGVGKSSIARHLLERIEAGPDDGAPEAEGAPATLVLSGRCYERDGTPYKAFDGLIDDLTRHAVDRGCERVLRALEGPGADALSRLFPALGRVRALTAGAEGGPPGDPSAEEAAAAPAGAPEELRARAFTALRELLARLGAEGPLVLFVDDLHWADPDSWALLREVMPARGAPPLLFLATARPLAAGLLPEHAREVPVAALDAEAAAALALRITGDPETAARIAREAHGHPLFLCELARFEGAREGKGGPAPVLEDALRARVGTLPGAARAALDLLAVAGVPTSEARLRRALSAAPEPFRAALAQLRQGRLARAHPGALGAAWESYHDRIRETVDRDLSPEARRAAHARLADAISAEGDAGQAPSLVRHLEAAGRPEEAARQALVAAEAALRGLAFDRAAELFAAALRLGCDEPGRARTALADALAFAGRGAEAARALDRAAEDVTGAARLACLRRAAEERLKSGHIEEGLTGVGRVLAGFGLSLPRTSRGALLSLGWRRLLLRARGLDWRPRAEGAVDPALLARIDAMRAVALGLGHVDHVRGADFQARALLLALRAGEPSRLAQALGLEAIFTALRGKGARSRARRLAREAARAAALVPGDGLARGWAISAVGASAFYGEARYADAARLLSEAEAAFRDEARGATWEVANTRVIRLRAERARGRIPLLRREVPALLRDAERRGDRFTAATLARLFSVAWLAGDDVPGAKEALLRSAWPEPPGGAFHNQTWYEMGAHGEIALYEGAASAAALHARMRPRFQALARSVLWRVEVVRAESAWLRGRLAIAAGRAGRPEAWDEARRMAVRLREVGTGFAAAWAALLLGGIALAEGRPDRARPHLEAAHRLSARTDQGLAALAARIRLGGSDGAAALQAVSALEVANAPRLIDMLEPGGAAPAPPPSP